MVGCFFNSCKPKKHEHYDRGNVETFKYADTKLECKITRADQGDDTIEISHKGIQRHKLELNKDLTSALRGCLTALLSSRVGDIGRNERINLLAFFANDMKRQDIAEFLANCFGAQELLRHDSLRMTMIIAKGSPMLASLNAQLATAADSVPPGSADDQAAAALAVRTSDVVLDEVVGQPGSARAVM